MSSSVLHILRDEHAAIAAMLNSALTLSEAGPAQGHPADFFDSVGGMLFYVDEFPERRHHPNESNLLFPMLLKAAPEMRPVIHRLEMDHAAGEGRVRDLLHLLNGWRFVGESRRDAFVRALREYVRFYLAHMRLEEAELLPLIATRLGASERQQLDATFSASRDPLIGGPLDDEYAALFRRITEQARAPVGLHAG